MESGGERVLSVCGFWFEAISADLKESGLNKAQVEPMRRMMESM